MDEPMNTQTYEALRERVKRLQAEVRAWREFALRPEGRCADTGIAADCPICGPRLRLADARTAVDQHKDLETGGS